MNIGKRGYSPQLSNPLASLSTSCMSSWMMARKSPVSTTAYIVLRGVQVVLCAALEYTSGTLAFYSDGDIGYRRLRRHTSPARTSSSSSYSSSLSDASSVWSAAPDPRARQIVLFTVVCSPSHPLVSPRKTNRKLPKRAQYQH